jgi:hypothetical protein
MANYMFVLRPTEKKFTTVCSACAKRGEVVDSCRTCHGKGITRKSVFQYYIQDRPIEINYIDRDPKTGILRYWEDASNFFYETVTPDLNNNVPNVPYGVHLCHDNWKSAEAECERINEYLSKKARREADYETQVEIQGRFTF